jgi:hypothetical protein
MSQLTYKTAALKISPHPGSELTLNSVFPSYFKPLSRKDGERS